MAERIQKVLARAGLASRRSIEDMVSAGRIRVNGQPARLGARVDPARDVVEADGRRLELAAERRRYLLLYKPRGVVSTLRDPQKRPTIRGLLSGVAERVYPVGRLDLDSEGLVLCTNDGDLAERVLHPRHGVWKTYVVEVEGNPSEAAVRELRSGVEIDGRRTAPARLKRLTKNSHIATTTALEVKIHEGRKQQLRRMFEQAGHPVARLRRTAIGPLSDSTLAPGQWRDLKPREVTQLRSAVGLS